ncbi:MAG: universal stress protein [Rhodospirillales bacterium]
MYKDILLAIDIDDKSSWTASTPIAVELAEKFGATLHVMVIIPTFGSSLVANFFPDGYEKKTMEEAATRLRAWTKTNIPGGIKKQHIVGHGRVYEEILRGANETDCDLIIVCDRRTNADMLGHNADKVAHQAKQSVLIVRH